MAHTHCYALVLSLLSFKSKNMYTTEKTKCSNFTCEIRTKCKRAELSIYDSEKPYYCFPYRKKLKSCNSFIPKI